MSPLSYPVNQGAEPHLSDSSRYRPTGLVPDEYLVRLGNLSILFFFSLAPFSILLFGPDDCIGKRTFTTRPSPTPLRTHRDILFAPSSSTFCALYRRIDTSLCSLYSRPLARSLISLASCSLCPAFQHSPYLAIGEYRHAVGMEIALYVGIESWKVGKEGAFFVCQ